MANANTPFGLRPVRYASGGPYNGSANVYSTVSGDGTAIFVGDPVTLSGTGSTIGGILYADVDQAATGDIIAGVVIGVLAETRDSLIYRAASTVRRVLVVDDPDVLFEIQETSGGTAFTANDVGLNANFAVGTGSTTTGQSAVEINNVGEATTATLDLQIVGLSTREDNAIGANAKWLVKINRNRYSNQVAGA